MKGYVPKGIPMEKVMADSVLQMVAEKMRNHEDMKREPEIMFKLWSDYGRKTIIKKMRAVVERKVKAYHRDFYYIDMSELHGTSFSVPFLWIVRPTGTNMLQLTKEITDISNTVRYNAQDRNNEIYFVNPKTSALIRIL